ncbi:hypothetical protein E4U59_004877 [Claviceps monticola]|nr:hypothetical protein E4U59_004877 [Claviceps monticola]
MPWESSLRSSRKLEAKAQHVLNVIRSRTVFTARRSSSCMVTPKRSHKASVLFELYYTELKRKVENMQELHDGSQGYCRDQRETIRKLAEQNQALQDASSVRCLIRTNYGDMVDE